MKEYIILIMNIIYITKCVKYILCLQLSVFNKFKRINQTCNKFEFALKRNLYTYAGCAAYLNVEYKFI